MDIPLALNRSIFTEKIKLCMWQHVHPAEVFALFLHPRFFGPLLDGTSVTSASLEDVLIIPDPKDDCGFCYCCYCCYWFREL